MAQKFLNGPEITTLRQKMRREGMPQSMGRRAFRQSQVAAQHLYPLLYRPWPQRPSPNGAKKRRVRQKFVRAGATIIGNSRGHYREKRDLALPVSLAGYQQHLLTRLRRIARGQRKSLTDAQAATIKEEQDRRIPLAHPGTLVQGAYVVQRSGGILRAERSRQPVRPLWRADKTESGIIEKLPARRPAVKGAHSRQRPGCRRGAQTTFGPPGKPGAEVSQTQFAQETATRQRPLMLQHKSKKSSQIALVGVQRMGRIAPLCAQPYQPGRNKTLQILIGLQAGQLGSSSHARMICSRLRARNCSSSVACPSSKCSGSRAPRARIAGGVVLLIASRNSA